MEGDQALLERRLQVCVEMGKTEGKGEKGGERGERGRAWETGQRGQRGVETGKGERE
jgi:hypothetical protein